MSNLEQDRLLDQLRQSKYNLRNIPVGNDSRGLNVEIGLVLKKIIQVVRRTFVRCICRGLHVIETLAQLYLKKWW